MEINNYVMIKFNTTHAFVENKNIPHLLKKLNYPIQRNDYSQRIASYRLYLMGIITK